MPRNTNGTYTLPPNVNPVIDGTIIDASAFNTTMNDIATGITLSLARDGVAPMSGALKLADGSVGSPSLTFNSDNTSGLYRPAAGVMAFGVAGAEHARFTAGNLIIGSVVNNGSKLQVTGTTSLTGGLTVTGTTIFSGTAPVNFAAPLVISAYEGLRLTNGSGYISGFSADGLTRQGYLQFSTNGAVALTAEGATNFIQLSTAGGTAKLLVGGTFETSGLLSARAGAVVNGNVAATSFTGDGQNVVNVKFSNLINGPLASNWANVATYGADLVSGMLAWRNYGNGHVIFDASKGLSPTGSAVNNINPANLWSPSYPTLMGWNGSGTYGVRVDSARVADLSGTTNQTLFGRVNTAGITYGSYGSISVTGTNGGYAGIVFNDAAAALMITTTQSGIYRNNGTWDWRFENGLLVEGKIPASSIVGTVGAGGAALATKASTLAAGGGDGVAMTFNYVGQSGTPTWVWGATSNSVTHVYSPANFSVAYATNSGTSAACSGNAATATSASSATNAQFATSAGSATNATNATNATTAASCTGNSATATYATSAGSANSASSASTATNCTAVQNYPGQTTGAAYPVLWNVGSSFSPTYSCAAVTITSSSGTLSATNLYASNDVTIRSDARVKTEVQVIEDALAKLKQIRGVTYTRTDKGSQAGRHAGVIAQEVRAVLPEVVREDVDGMLHVAYGNMISILIEAVKELSDKVDALEAK